ncbi:MAG: hypothetical protein ACO1N9_03525 [Flavobacterium sp.]
MSFYGALIGSTILFMGIGCFLSIEVYDHYISGNLTGKKRIWPLLSIALLFMGPYTIYCYYRNSPIIKSTLRSISFNKTTFSLEEILEVEYTSKQIFKYLTPFYMEAMKITFKNSSEKIVFDDMYSNSHELKNFLDSQINKKPFIKIKNINYDVSREHLYIYKGNFLLTMRGIFAVLVIGCFIGITIKIPSILGSVILGIFTLIFIFLFASQVNYFGVNETFFTVKNHILFWRSKSFQLEDIKEIVYETRSKAPNCLRIILKDYCTKLFPAGTLSDGQWKDMQSHLREYSVTVRNECIF